MSSASRHIVRGRGVFLVGSGACVAILMRFGEKTQLPPAGIRGHDMCFGTEPSNQATQVDLLGIVDDE